MELPIHFRRGGVQASAAGPNPRPRHRAAAASGLLLLLLALATAQPGLWSRWLAPPWGEITGLAQPGCDLLQQPCRITFTDGSRAVVTMAPEGHGDPAALLLTVQVQGHEPRSIGIDLDGESMNMGPNHTELSAQPDGRWTGRTALSACITGRMAWILTLRAPVGGGLRVARLRFESGEP